MSHEYVELHCHSNYSFQEGASFIHETLAQAVELGMLALALTDLVSIRLDWLPVPHSGLLTLEMICSVGKFWDTVCLHE